MLNGFGRDVTGCWLTVPVLAEASGQNLLHYIGVDENHKQVITLDGALIPPPTHSLLETKNLQKGL